jgi:hypothetical protein
MSVSSLLPVSTKNENWSALNAFSLNTNHVQADLLSVGLAPNTYDFPAGIGATGQVLAVEDGALEFKTPNYFVTASFGGSVTAGSARFLKLNGVNNGATTTAADNGSLFVSPYPLFLTAITIIPEIVNAGTQFQIRLDNTVLFNVDPSNFAVILNTPLPLSPENVCDVSWQQVGPAPGDTTVTLWFEVVE